MGALSLTPGPGQDRTASKQAAATATDAPTQTARCQRRDARAPAWHLVVTCAGPAARIRASRSAGTGGRGRARSRDSSESRRPIRVRPSLGLHDRKPPQPARLASISKLHWCATSRCHSVHPVPTPSRDSSCPANSEARAPSGPPASSPSRAWYNRRASSTAIAVSSGSDRRDRRTREAPVQGRDAPLRPLAVDEFRVGDPVQPGGQGRSPLECGDSLPSGGKSLLREVLGPRGRRPSCEAGSDRPPGNGCGPARRTPRSGRHAGCSTGVGRLASSKGPPPASQGLTNRPPGGLRGHLPESLDDPALEGVGQTGNWNRPSTPLRSAHSRSSSRTADGSPSRIRNGSPSPADGRRSSSSRTTGPTSST